MASDVHSMFSFNFKHILIDEIALNGLEGIGLGTLWNHVESRISAPLTQKMKARFWKTLVNCEEISFYQNPVPVPTLPVLDRFSVIDQNSGYLLEPDYYLDGEYEYHPVEGQYGSCVYFNERIPESRESLIETHYDKIAGTDYGDRLVMVASIEERWKALADHKPISFLNKLSPVHFCILELIGKARGNGQVTTGVTNLTKILKDPKFMFYNRNFLQKQDLIRSQNLQQKTIGKNSLSILLMIKRFYRPNPLCLPKMGKIRDKVDFLMEQPDFTANTGVLVEKGIAAKTDFKPLQKRTSFFEFEDRMAPPRAGSNSKRSLIKTKFITFTCPSDQESNDSDVDDDVPCTYKIGVSLMRQAYELVFAAGQKGITQIELGHFLGVEFYTARAICVILRASKICKETIEDKGRQRMSRFVLMNIKTGVDEYEKEEKKLLDYMSQDMSQDISQDMSQDISLNDTIHLDGSVNEINTEEETNPQSSKRRDSSFDSEIPQKKKKTLDQPAFNPYVNEMETVVEEVKQLDNLEPTNPKLFKTKKLSLRQLRLMNGIIKVLREQMAVTGVCTLSALVAKEINEPPIDSKRLKVFLQKLMNEGQIKVLKMKWPGDKPRFTHFFCARDLKPSDPIIVTKYKELCLRLMKFEDHKQGKVKTETATTPVFLHAFPRYMRIQKMHELITKMVYFERDETELSKSNIPEGFASVVYIIPEMTIENILSNMKQTERLEALQKNIDKKYFDVKLKEVPPEVSCLLTNAPGLLDNIRANLRLLAILGLIQLVKESTQVSDNVQMSYAFYVNRHPKILDTTGTWPRKCIVQDIEKSYYFETYKDVETYWRDVYNISINTDVQVERSVRQRKTMTPGLCLRSEVAANDNGTRFGNGLGPCGFDATFFMDAPRFWSNFYCKLRNKHQYELKKISIKNKDIKVKKVKQEKKPKGRPRGTRKVHKPQHARQKIPKAKPQKSGTILRKPVKWKPIEDKMIMLAKAAITIMSPESQAGSLRLRNIIARDIVSLSDPKKFAATCHVRAQTVEFDPNLVYEKECLINEVRHRETLLRKYGGLLKKLKVKYPVSLARSIQEARLPMMELMWILHEISMNESFNKRVPCVALNYEDFNVKYNICLASGNSLTNMYHTPLELGPRMAALKEAIVLTVLLSYRFEQPPGLPLKIYKMFTNYPELMLREAIEPLRKCGAVSARDKIINNIQVKAYLEEICQSQYKVAATYQRRWITRFSTDFIDKLGDLLDISVECPVAGFKGNPELNCFLSELQGNNILELTSVTPPFVDAPSDAIIQDEQLSAGEIFEKQNLMSGTCGWELKVKIKRFTEIYDDFEITDTLKKLARSSCIDLDVVQQQDPAIIDQEIDIVNVLRTKKESGITFPELQKLTNYESKTLQEKLEVLESGNIIKIVGYYENIIVMTEFIEDWTVSIGNMRIVPVPWHMLENDQIRLEIFLNWAIIALETVFKHPGCSMKLLSEKCEFLTTRSAQDLCMALETFKCVRLNVLIDIETDWCAEDETVPQLEDFNPYESVENIVVFPVKDSFTRYSYVKKKLLEEHSKQ